MISIHGAEALSICTVSDQMRTGESLSAEERRSSFDAMIQAHPGHDRGAAAGPGNLTAATGFGYRTRMGET